MGWLDGGGPIEGDSNVLPAAPARVRASRERRGRDALFAVVDRIGNMRLSSILGTWAAVVAVCGVGYWLAVVLRGDGLRTSAGPITADLPGFLTALYFSFVTATSVGYGDVVPVGPVRVLAIAEAISGLLLFGVLISKFVSRRQELLIEAIHRTTFEERLGRLRTNLHLVLSELQTLSEMCSGSSPSPRILIRIESAGAVFVGELRSIHDLLYRPQAMPEEQVLEAILASLGSCLDEFVNLLTCLPADTRTATLDSELDVMSRIASEICGDCVPREYAPELKEWMNRVQSAARRLTI